MKPQAWWTRLGWDLHMCFLCSSDILVAKTGLNLRLLYFLILAATLAVSFE